MPQALQKLVPYKNPPYSYQQVHNMWVEIFETAKKQMASHLPRAGVYARYDGVLQEAIVAELNGNYMADMFAGSSSGSSTTAKFRNALLELVQSGRLDVFYEKLKSAAAGRTEVKLVYEALQAELQLTNFAKLTSAEQAGSTASVENKVASNALKLLKAGGPFVAGLTAADVVVFAKTWLDQLPDTTPQSPEMVELKQYVQEHGPETANDHMMNQYMQDAEQVQ